MGQSCPLHYGGNIDGPVVNEVSMYIRGGSSIEAEEVGPLILRGKRKINFIFKKE